jgi:hypothetical protein
VLRGRRGRFPDGTPCFEVTCGGSISTRRLAVKFLLESVEERLKSRLATISLDDIRAVERAIRVQLGLSLS